MTKLKVDQFLDLVRRSELVQRNALNRVLLELKQRAGDQAIERYRVRGYEARRGRSDYRMAE